MQKNLQADICKIIHTPSKQMVFGSILIYFWNHLLHYFRSNDLVDRHFPASWNEFYISIQNWKSHWINMTIKSYVLTEICCYFRWFFFPLHIFMPLENGTATDINAIFDS